MKAPQRVQDFEPLDAVLYASDSRARSNKENHSATTLGNAGL
jgi:hypothetical protein